MGSLPEELIRAVKLSWYDMIVGVYTHFSIRQLNLRLLNKDDKEILDKAVWRIDNKHIDIIY